MKSETKQKKTYSVKLGFTAIIVVMLIASPFMYSFGQNLSAEQDNEQSMDWRTYYIEKGKDWLDKNMTADKIYTQKAVSEFLAWYLLFNRNKVELISDLPDKHDIFNGEKTDLIPVRVAIIFAYQDDLPGIFQPMRDELLENEFNVYVGSARSFFGYTTSIKNELKKTKEKYCMIFHLANNKVNEFYKYYANEYIKFTLEKNDIVSLEGGVEPWEFAPQKYYTKKLTNGFEEGFFTFKAPHVNEEYGTLVSFGKIGPYILYVIEDLAGGDAIRRLSIGLFGETYRDKILTGWLKPIVPED